MSSTETKPGPTKKRRPHPKPKICSLVPCGPMGKPPSPERLEIDRLDRELAEIEREYSAIGNHLLALDDRKRSLTSERKTLTRKRRK